MVLIKTFVERKTGHKGDRQVKRRLARRIQ